MTLPPVPAWLANLLDPPRPSVPTRQVISHGSSAYANAALELECVAVAGAPVGTRNDTLNRAAFNIGTLIGAELLNGTDVADALLDAARHAGLREKEALATIVSGLHAGVAHPREVTP